MSRGGLHHHKPDCHCPPCSWRRPRAPRFDGLDFHHVFDHLANELERPKPVRLILEPDKPYGCWCRLDGITQLVSITLWNQRAFAFDILTHHGFEVLP